MLLNWSMNAYYKLDVVERLYKVTIPEEVEIFVPHVPHYKGCRKKRLIGEVEKSIMKVPKKTRKCSVCGKSTTRKIAFNDAQTMTLADSRYAFLSVLKNSVRLPKFEG
uniref:Uncharacterized protein n=1 Tax=Lactuca sativa TaxID=4236 RepID=A0A9R1UIE8_LACSA|nr:hypothetical protein LSAT_V11C900494770 [Lactuca sativa]